MFFSFSQGSAYMFRYQKADPEGHLRRRRRTTIHLPRLAEEAIILLATRWRGPSLLTEAACLLTFLHLRCLLPRDEQLTLTVVMANEMVMGWLITMRNLEPALTAQQATMTGVPSPLLRLLPRHWLENVSEWEPLTRTSDVRSPLLLLRPPWSGTEAPSDEPPFRLLHQQAMGTPMSGLGSPRSPGLRCIQPPAPGTPSRIECRCHHHHPDMQAIRPMKV